MTEIRDPVHGYVKLEGLALELADTPQDAAAALDQAARPGEPCLSRCQSHSLRTQPWGLPSG